VAGRIRSIDKSNDFIGNRICDLLACNVAPQPATLPRVHGVLYLAMSNANSCWSLITLISFLNTWIGNSDGCLWKRWLNLPERNWVFDWIWHQKLIFLSWAHAPSPGAPLCPLPGDMPQFGNHCPDGFLTHAWPIYIWHTVVGDMDAFNQVLGGIIVFHPFEVVMQ
jgi:hypothetical protein